MNKSKLIVTAIKGMVTTDPRAARVSWLVLQSINPHLIRKETMMGSMAADTFAPLAKW